ncbi:hypothetical protein NMY22_g8521 [Coprinellus aureogranulatus]|nr:hypothetical protein NMY22_g8521 [Coprinellus aureogranulatus]
MKSGLQKEVLALYRRCVRLPSSFLLEGIRPKGLLSELGFDSQRPSYGQIQTRKREAKIPAVYSIYVSYERKVNFAPKRQRNRAPPAEGEAANRDVRGPCGNSVLRFASYEGLAGYASHTTTSKHNFTLKSER